MTGRGLFDTLPDDARHDTLQQARRRSFARREVIFHEDDPGDTLHVIERGHVAIRVNTALGDVGTLAILGPDDFFGEQALLGADARRTASAVAVEQVVTLSLSREHFSELCARHRSVQQLLVDVLAAQVRRLSDQLIEAMFVPAEQRVLRRLLALVPEYGDAPGADAAGPQVTVALTQEDLASLAGSTRSTANRVLRQAEEDAVVALRRGRIEILDLDGLRRSARVPAAAPTRAPATSGTAW